jgi:hypothetical protein
VPEIRDLKIGTIKQSPDRRGIELSVDSEDDIWVEFTVGNETVVFEYYKAICDRELI